MCVPRPWSFILCSGINHLLPTWRWTFFRQPKGRQGSCDRRKEKHQANLDEKSVGRKAGIPAHQGFIPKTKHASRHSDFQRGQVLEKWPKSLWHPLVLSLWPAQALWSICILGTVVLFCFPSFLHCLFLSLSTMSLVWFLVTLHENLVIRGIWEVGSIVQVSVMQTQGAELKTP